MKTWVIKINQRNRYYSAIIFITTLTLENIRQIAKYNIRNPKKGTGYQRQIDERRLRYGTGSPVKYLLDEEGTFPTSILLCARNKEKIRFEQKFKIDDYAEVGILYIDKDSELYIVDGQHRVEALNTVVRMGHKDFLKYPLPVSIIVPEIRYGDPYFEELRHFYIVNSRAKSVPTDLAMQLLYEMYKKFNLVKLMEIEGKRSALRGMAVEIVKKLNEINENNPWYNKIDMESVMRPAPGYLTTLRPIADSLTYIIEERSFRGMDTQTLAKTLADYWSAIRDVYPEAFQDPDSYTITASTGIYVFNMIFPTIYGKLLSQDKKITRDNFRKILNKLKKNEVEGRELNAEFWHKYKGPGIARATSMKMIKDLAKQLEEIVRSMRGEE